MFLRTEETAYQDLIAMNDVYTHDVRDTLRSEMARPISDVMRSNTQHWAPGDQGQCRGQLLRSGVGHYASSPGSRLAVLARQGSSRCTTSSTLFPGSLRQPDKTIIKQFDSLNARVV